MNRIIRISSLILILALTGCEKNWLNVKRNLNTVLPTTLQDYRSILNGSSSPNMAMNYTFMSLISGEEISVSDDIFNTGIVLERNLFCWKAEVYPDAVSTVSDWDDTFKQVFNANVVLDGLPSVERNAVNEAEWDDVKGGALFFRAKAFYNLSQEFAAPYDLAGASQNPNGIPLRLSSDPNPATVRANVGQTYDRIVQDLKMAIPLLTITPRLLTDASRPAAYGLLSRCFLSMGDYRNAMVYADSALKIHPALIDYAALMSHSDDTYPIPDMNEETLFYSTYFTTPTYLIYSLGMVRSELMAFYEENDLRRALFFNEAHSFRGNYTASFRLFNGLASDELYLIRAECRARTGLISEALEDLNALMGKRFATGKFAAYTVENSGNILELILQERRKELLFRGLRWSDLRRLGQEPDHTSTLQRTIIGQSYSLPVNSSRYTLPIPEYIIQQTGIPQNLRIQD